MAGLVADLRNAAGLSPGAPAAQVGVYGLAGADTPADTRRLTAALGRPRPGDRRRRGQRRLRPDPRRSRARLGRRAHLRSGRQRGRDRARRADGTARRARRHLGRLGRRARHRDGRPRRRRPGARRTRPADDPRDAGAGAVRRRAADRRHPQDRGRDPGRIDGSRELSPIVFAAAGAGDAVARSILDRQADELIAMARAIIVRLRMTRLRSDGGPGRRRVRVARRDVRCPGRRRDPGDRAGCQRASFRGAPRHGRGAARPGPDLGRASSASCRGRRAAPGIAGGVAARLNRRRGAHRAARLGTVFRHPWRMDLPATKDQTDSLWRPDRRALTLGLVLTITLVGFESLAISTVMPIVAKELGDLELYGWVFSAFFLGSLIGIVVVGGAIDRGGLAVPFAHRPRPVRDRAADRRPLAVDADPRRRPVPPGARGGHDPTDRLRRHRADAPRIAPAADVRHALDRVGPARRDRPGHRRDRRRHRRLALCLPRSAAADRAGRRPDARRPARDRRCAAAGRPGALRSPARPAAAGDHRGPRIGAADGRPDDRPAASRRSS